nr:hypothetical protein [Tanacetum cinerariifolium]
MRLEQYFLMTGYLLWEVILNGDSSVPTRVVEGVVQLVGHTSAEQKLARRSELKACGTLLMALPNKHQLKFNSHKDAKTLMEAIEKQFGGNTETKKVQKTLLKQQFENFTGYSSEGLDLIHDRLQKLVSQLDIHGVSLSQEDVNLNTTDSVSAAASVSAICAKLPVSSLPNVDSLSNAIDVDDLEEMDLKWQMAMLTIRARRSQPSGGYHAVPPPITRTFMPPKPNLVFHTAPITVKTDHSAFTIQLSTFKPAHDLSHTNRPIAPIIEDWVSDFEDESETKAPQIVPSFVQSSKQVKTPRHFVQPVVTSIPAATPKPTSPKSNSSGKRKNRKTCFMCKNVNHLIKDYDCHAKKMAQPTPRNYTHRVLTQSKPVFNTAVRPVSAVVPNIMMTRPRLFHLIITKSKSPIRRYITRSPSPKTSNLPLRVTAAKAPVVSATQGMQGKWGTCDIYLNLRSLVVDMLSLEELKFNIFSVSQMCDKKNSVLFTDTECLVLSPDFKLPDESQVLLRVPRENNIKDETSPILKTFITGLENQLSLKVKVIRSDNGTKFKNSDLNQAARTMLADSLLPILFWAEVVNTACYVQNRVLVTKPHNKTPYELLHGRTPSIGFMRPFGYPVTILNTLDSLGKFKGKVDEGFLVGYSINSKAFRVFNSRTRIVQETLHVNFLKNKPNIAGSGPTWLFDIDSLTRTMNYQPVTTGNQTNPSKGFQDKFHAEKAGEEIDQQYVLFLVWSFGFTNPQNYDGHAAFDEKEHDFDAKKPESEVNVSPSSGAQSRKQDDKIKKEAKGKSPVESFIGYRDLSREFEDCSENSSNEVNTVGTIVPTVGQNSLNITHPFSTAGPSNTTASRTHRQSSFKDASQPTDDPDMPELEDITYSNDENDVGTEADFNNLETSIIEEPKRVHQALKDPSWIEAMQEELLQFKMNKKDERGIVVMNKARLIAQGHIQDEGIDYKEVFAPVARIKAIRLFLAYASFMGFIVYQMDVKSAFLYETIEEEVYVCQPLGFEYPDHPDKVYKVVKALYGLHQAPRAWYETLANYLQENGFQRADERQVPDEFYGGTHILFGSSRKSASTPIDTEKPLLKDPNGEDVDVHAYRSMIGSLMYITSSRPYIMFADSPFDLVAYSDSDYAGASLDRKSTTRGCQFLGCRLISWRCKKQTVVATSSIEAEYVAAASCCAQVLWIQNQLLDYGKGFNQVIDFLNGNYINQLWNTVTIKQDNEVTRMQALVDTKKVVVTEAAIRDVLRLDDTEAVDFLPNEEIFAELACMGYEKPSTKLTFYKAFFSSQWKFLIHTILQPMSAKRTSWNEFSSAMASVVICLSTSDLSTHTTKYASPALTQKVFANMRRVGKGFSRAKTPLFEGMLLGQEIKEGGDVEEHVQDVTAGDATQGDDTASHGEVLTVSQEPSIPSPTIPTPPPQPPQDLSSTSQKGNRVKVLKLRRLKRIETSHRIDTSNDTVMDDASNQGRIIDKMYRDDAVALMDDKEDDKKDEEAKVDENDQEDKPAEVHEVVYVVTTAKLITKVVTAASETVTAAITAAPSKRRKGVVIRDPEKESTTSLIIHADTKSKDKGKGVMVEEPKPLKKKQQIEMDEEYARKLHAELNKDIDWDVAIDHVKLKAKEDPAERYQAMKRMP